MRQQNPTHAPANVRTYVRICTIYIGTYKHTTKQKIRYTNVLQNLPHGCISRKYKKVQRTKLKLEISSVETSLYNAYGSPVEVEPLLGLQKLAIERIETIETVKTVETEETEVTVEERVE